MTQGDFFLDTLDYLRTRSQLGRGERDLHHPPAQVEPDGSLGLQE